MKFGARVGADGAMVGFDARPAAVTTALAYLLHRLGTDYVDVYRPARLDPDVPIEDTIGAIGELVDAGHVRHFGLSEARAQTIRRAADVRLRSATCRSSTHWRTRASSVTSRRPVASSASA